EPSLEGAEIVPLQCGSDGIRTRELVGRIGCGDGQAAHPGRMGRLDADDAVFYDETVRRLDRCPSVQGLQGVQVSFRIGLPVPDVLGRGDVLEAGPQSDEFKYKFDLVAQRDRQDREAVATGTALYEVIDARLMM